MRLALWVILLLHSGYSFAGPAIPAIAAYFGVTAATVIIVGQIIITVALSIYGSAQQRKAARRARDNARRQFNANLEDRTITAVSAESPHRYIYGRSRVGSSIVAIFKSGSKDQYKHIVCIHAAHECDGFEEMWLNGKPLGTLDGDGAPIGGDFGKIETVRKGESKTGPTFSLAEEPIENSLLVTHTESSQDWFQLRRSVPHPYTIDGKDVTLTDSYSGSVKASYQHTQTVAQVRWKKHLGVPGDPADSTLMAELPSKWPSTATLNGLCYSYIRLDLNHQEFKNGIPAIEVLLRGKKLYDPRDMSTIWNSNNALAIYDYLTSEMCGVPAADLPEADFITAANVCDEQFTFGSRYTFNGTVHATQSQASVLEDMAQSMAGSIVSTTWGVTAGKYIAPVAVLDQSDIVGSVSVNPGLSDADLYNGVRGQYISPDNDYVVTDFEPFQNTAYVAADGGELWTDITFPFTDDKQLAHNLARIFTEDQRNGYTIKAEFSLKAWPRKIGERITFNSDLFGHIAKIFRITDRSYSPEGVLELTLKEDAASIWDFANSVSPDDTPNSNLSNPFFIEPLTNVEALSGDSHNDDLILQADGTIITRVHVQWDQSTNQAVANQGIIEIEWIDIDSIIPQRMQVNGDETEVHITPVSDGVYYDIRVRAVDPYFNVKSDWTYVSGHYVVGKLAPPNDVTGFAISGRELSHDEVADIDLGGYRFKFHYGNNTDWNSAIPLHNGIITGHNPYPADTLPFGTVTIMAKAVDTSGNESVNTANIFTNLGDPTIGNVVEVIDFDPTYIGTITGGSVIGGDVVADALDSFYGTDEQSFYDLDSLSFYEPSAYDAVQYTSYEVSIVSGLAGSRMTIESVILGDGVVVEYRLTGAGSFYGEDADPFYEVDGDPFYDAAPGPWLIWPGQITATPDGYQFRVSINAGVLQGEIQELSVVIDAPDYTESIADLSIGATPTAIPYLFPFTGIKVINATLQANGSGAETVEIDKSDPLAPTILAYNSSHTAVSGAQADIIIQGY